MNSDETILRRVKNARTINHGDDVAVNDGYGGYISTPGSVLHYLLGEEPKQFDPDEDLPLESEAQ